MGAIKEKIAELADMAEQILDSGVSDQELDEFMEAQLSPEDVEFYHAHKDVIFGMLGWGPEEYEDMDESIKMPRLNEDSFDEQEWLEDDKELQPYEEWLDEIYWQMDSLLDHDIDEDYTKELFIKHEDELRKMHKSGLDTTEAAQGLIDADQDELDADPDNYESFDESIIMPRMNEKDTKKKPKKCDHDINPKTGKCSKCGGYFRPHQDDI